MNLKQIIVDGEVYISKKDLLKYLTTPENVSKYSTEEDNTSKDKPPPPNREFYTYTVNKLFKDSLVAIPDFIINKVIKLNKILKVFYKDDKGTVTERIIRQEEFPNREFINGPYKFQNGEGEYYLLYFKWNP